ncbi:hypothetical protein C7447_102117 [Tenacibaculum adriaticum]|uniref:DUF6984 domain-containing protein n=1 Tax=Tenacibaculum adriaticum TaxID=413713 RepID=A0A5S5DVK2_9FLAO|nr:hypothetical protein [Tenacibaculum adriaticum]TYP98802.1 hypothetical protein C7447_102117 [Tenacibaculum adriaticum]
MIREIREEEKKLIAHIVKDEIEIPKFIRELKDGGMGSISFDLNKKSIRYESLFNAEFIDSDGLLVDIELTIDEQGNLFEFDFFKVDFNKLINYPKYENLTITKCNI